MKFVNDKKNYVKSNIKGLPEHKVVRICLDHDFDDVSITKALKQYETEEKYKGMQEYEWNTIQSKEE